MKAFLVGALLAMALAGGASGSTAWTSEYFHSPTHNIHCRWFWNEELMACVTQNNGRMVAVTEYGNAYTRYGTSGHSFPAGPTLYYGETWRGYDGNNDTAVRCWSRSTGMTCKSLKTGHGFWIAKEGYRLF